MQQCKCVPTHKYVENKYKKMYSKHFFFHLLFRDEKKKRIKIGANYMYTEIRI